MFPGSFSRNCAWLALEGCRIRAKRLSTNSHNIVSQPLKVQKQCFRCKTAQHIRQRALLSQRAVISGGSTVVAADHVRFVFA
jgi:hypothetical protein